MYYLRTRPAADPIKFTVDKTRITSTNKTGASPTEKLPENPGESGTKDEQILTRKMRQCNMTDENGACLMCSS